MSAPLSAGNTRLATNERELNPGTAKAAIRSPSLRRQVCQCLAVASLALVSYLAVTHYLLQAVRVVGVSMSPTLKDSEQYLLNRWVYYWRAPPQGDVVVIRDPIDNTFSVKRIIAVAGESVWLNDGCVYLNGRKLSEPYLQPGTPTYPYATLKEQVLQCGKDEYLVLGDNRKNSADS